MTPLTKAPTCRLDIAEAADAEVARRSLRVEGNPDGSRVTAGLELARVIVEQGEPNDNTRLIAFALDGDLDACAAGNRVAGRNFETNFSRHDIEEQASEADRGGDANSFSLALGGDPFAAVGETVGHLNLSSRSLDTLSAVCDFEAVVVL